MANTAWRHLPDRFYECQACGHKFQLAEGAKFSAPSHDCKTPEQRKLHECIHNLGVLRIEGCPTCLSQTGIKVFACELHGEVTIHRLLDIKACIGCGDFTK